MQSGQALCRDPPAAVLTHVALVVMAVASVPDASRCRPTLRRPDHPILHGPDNMRGVAVEPDLEEREAWIPPELEKLLKEERTLAKWYAKLSEPTRREIGKYIDDVKGAEARQRRAEQMAERLMLTMESEKILPPILEVAFGRNPKARKGWDAMTATQRRGHLMGVFYYQSPEAREKRVGKLVEDCLRVGESSRR